MVWVALGPSLFIMILRKLVSFFGRFWVPMEPIYVKSLKGQKINFQGRKLTQSAQIVKCEALKEGFRTSRRLRRRPKSYG